MLTGFYYKFGHHGRKVQQRQSFTIAIKGATVRVDRTSGHLLVQFQAGLFVARKVPAHPGLKAPSKFLGPKGRCHSQQSKPLNPYFLPHLVHHLVHLG